MRGPAAPQVIIYEWTTSDQSSTLASLSVSSRVLHWPITTRRICFSPQKDPLQGGVRWEKPRCFDPSGFVLTYLILWKFLEYRILVLVRISLKVNLVSLAFVSSSKRRTSDPQAAMLILLSFWSCFLLSLPFYSGHFVNFNFNVNFFSPANVTADHQGDRLKK